MNVIGIFIGLVGLLLIISVVWMSAVSAKQKRLESDKQARMEAHRQAVKRNHAEERLERVQKAEANHIPSILFLAKEAELRDLKEAAYWYEKAGYLGNVTGMYGIVRLCSRIEGDVVVNEKIRFWKRYIKGAEGDINALFETGKALISGLGVATERDLGIKVVEQAAMANLTEAQIYMGDLCLSGDSAAEKIEDSSYWFAKAAKLGNSEAMMKLGLNYINGRGIAKDLKKGCFWLESAAEKGDAKAMYHAGKAWMGVGQHGTEIAYIWFYLASQCDYQPAKALRDEVAAGLGVDSLVLLQGFANPLLKKLRSGTAVTRHIVIRALNRLYQRGVPIPNAQVAEDDSADNGDEAFLRGLIDAKLVPVEPASAEADAMNSAEKNSPSL